MSEEIPKNTKKTDNPYKKDVFDIYVTWKAIPPFVRQKGPNNNPLSDINDPDIEN